MPKGGKGKRSSGANEIVKEDTAVSVSEPQIAPAAEPQIEEGAFAGLRQKIEQRLKDQSSGKGKGGKKENKTQASTENSTTKKEKQNVAPKSDKKKQDSAHGKKRDRNGDVIAREEEAKTAAPKKESNNDNLRQEIMAMGGTEADLDLLADVDSESEVEGEALKKKGREADLRRELSNMLAAAGHVVPEDLADDEVEEVEEEEEEDDDEEDEDEAEGEDVNDADSVEEDDNEDSNEQDADSFEESDIEDTPPAPKPKQVEAPIPKEYAKLAIQPRSDWYNVPLPPVAGATQMNALPRHLVERIHEQAKVLLLEENEEYAKAQKTSASSSHKFYSTIMSNGTLSDKISALTLAVQESPLHNTKSLESLVGLAGKRSRAQAVEVLRSLKDMFAQGTLLPSDRRLRSFANQPGLVAAFQGAGGRWTERDPLPGGLQKSHLMLWAFEDGVKEQFYEVLKILEVWCNDEIEFSRSRAVSYVYELLKEKPEQEANLLRLLVNKLGDPGKKIASRASYLLLQLEQQHPLMKPTIIKSVEELLFRPGQSSTAKYYAIITLNQTVLSMKEQQVSMQLLDIYFSLFVTLLKPAPKGKPHGKPQGKPGKGKGKQDPAKGQAQDDELREKLTSGVLTGVNRAYPFTDADSGRMSKHIDTLFRITHSSNFNTSIQALMLIQQLTHTTQVASDRFYRTLYESLLDPRVATSSKQSLYLNLLFKALKNDLNVRRVKAFVKRIVQVLGMHQPSFICGVFYLIRELEKTFIGLSSLLDQPEDNESDDEEVFRDVPDEDDDVNEQPEPITDTTTKKPKEKYDPRKRDPEHSNADESCLWELLPYTTHFHPSVSLNADRLLDHEPMSGKPDLTIHTLSHFLDRFIYRTPKSSASSRGASIMQPLAGGEAKDRLVDAGKTAMQGVPLNSEGFWKKKAEDVAAEDVFFHEYFNRVNKDKVKAKRGKTADASRGEGSDDEIDDEDAIWKALVDSRPDLEDEVDSDDDLDMDDLESAYDDDSAEEGEGEGEGEGDEDVIFNDESDVPTDEEEEGGDFEGFDSPPPTTKAKKSAKADKEEKPDAEDEDAFDMDVSDDEAFLDSDEDLPSDMEFGGVNLESIPEPESEGKGKKDKRRKLKHLPTFASADDYAALLEDEDMGM